MRVGVHASDAYVADTSYDGVGEKERGKGGVCEVGDEGGRKRGSLSLKRGACCCY